METLIDLVRRLRSSYNIPVTKIHGHHDLNPETECPGENFQTSVLQERITQ